MEERVKEKLTKRLVMLRPIELAANIHNKFVTIIPPIYRADYIACAYQGHKGNDVPFINLLSSMVYESQKEFLKLVKG